MGFDLIDIVSEELWVEVSDIVQEVVIQTIWKKEKCIKENDLSHSQLLVLFVLSVYSFSIFSCEYNQFDFGIDHLVMSMWGVISCVGRGRLLWPVCSFGKTLLTFSLLHFVLQVQNFLLLQVSLDFLLLHSSPIQRTPFLGNSSRRTYRSS